MRLIKTLTLLIFLACSTEAFQPTIWGYIEVNDASYGQNIIDYIVARKDFCNHVYVWSVSNYYLDVSSAPESHRWRLQFYTTWDEISSEKALEVKEKAIDVKQDDRCTRMWFNAWDSNQDKSPGNSAPVGANKIWKIEKNNHE